MSAWAQELRPIPPYAPVVDLTGVLTPAERAALTQKLMAFEQAHGSEFAVVMVATTKPEPIEDYANRLANTWKLGRQGIGDGVVLVIAVSDRASRIEVSRALEGAIPDLETKRILQRDVTPSLRRGAFHEGIDKGLDSLFADIENENLPLPAGRPPASAEVPAAAQTSSAPDSPSVDAAQVTEHEPQRSSRSVIARVVVASAEYLFVALVLVSQFVWPVLGIWLLLKLLKDKRPSSSDTRATIAFRSPMPAAPAAAAIHRRVARARPRVRTVATTPGVVHPIGGSAVRSAAIVEQGMYSRPCLPA